MAISLNTLSKFYLPKSILDTESSSNSYRVVDIIDSYLTLAGGLPEAGNGITVTSNTWNLGGSLTSNLVFDGNTNVFLAEDFDTFTFTATTNFVAQIFATDTVLELDSNSGSIIAEDILMKATTNTLYLDARSVVLQADADSLQINATTEFLLNIPLVGEANNGKVLTLIDQDTGMTAWVLKNGLSSHEAFPNNIYTIMLIDGTNVYSVLDTNSVVASVFIDDTGRNNMEGERITIYIGPTGAGVASINWNFSYLGEPPVSTSATLSTVVELVWSDSYDGWIVIK